MLSIFLGSISNKKNSQPLNVLLASCLAVCLFLFSLNIQAASQGTRGASSSGTVETVVTVGRVIRIDSLRDFNFGTWNLGDGSLSDNDNVCIGKNDIGGPYAVRASGNGDGFDPAAFTLSNGVDQIRYNVSWNDANGTGGNQALTPGLILHGQTGTPFVFFLNLIGFCFTNANVQIEIPATELQAAGSGNYAGTLTLLIIPD